MRIISSILLMAFTAGFLGACDMMAQEPMAAEGAMAEGEMAHEDMAAEPAM